MGKWWWRDSCGLSYWSRQVTQSSKFSERCYLKSRERLRKTVDMNMDLWSPHTCTHVNTHLHIATHIYTMYYSTKPISVVCQAHKWTCEQMCTWLLRTLPASINGGKVTSPLHNCNGHYIGRLQYVVWAQENLDLAEESPPLHFRPKQVYLIAYSKTPCLWTD